MEGFKTVNEAAKMLNRSTGHVRQLCIDGKLEGAQKMGNQWVIPEKSIGGYEPGEKGFAVVWKQRRARKAADAEFMRKFKEAAVPQGGKAEA